MAQSRFQPGDHLWKRGGRVGGKLYDHHVIYVETMDGGKHRIIENSFRAGRVVQKVLDNQKLERYALYERAADPVTCLANARAKLGEKYDLLAFNCETFANFCVRGAGMSRQVRQASRTCAISSAILGCGATAISVGIVTHEKVTVSSRASGVWGLLGYTNKAVIYKTVANPVGLAAASGVCCACGIFACLLAFRRDPRKRRNRGKGNTNSENGAAPQEPHPPSGHSVLDDVVPSSSSGSDDDDVHHSIAAGSISRQTQTADPESALSAVSGEGCGGRQEENPGF